MSGKKRIKGLNILRILACISVFLYHLNILKGGYLAVSIFFTLTGYLSCKSALSNDDFSIKKYYKNKLTKIYLPLLFIVFISIAVITNIKDISWINIKKETLSTILGYNNFWQLKANLNYFTKSISSPFMHLWYIAIILQYYLLFPFIYKILIIIKTKINNIIPIILLFILSIASYIYFIKTSNTNIMNAYYNTLSRAFQILLGMELAFIMDNKDYKTPKLMENKIINILTTTLYSILLIIQLILISSQSKYMYLSMLSSTIITLLLIENISSIKTTNKDNRITKIINYLSRITYEFYLIQYPVIYIFQYINISNKILYITLISITISIIIDLSINANNKKLKNILTVLLLAISVYGLYSYIIAKDYSKEMQQLEKELAQNEKLIEQSQAAFMENQRNEQDRWNELLESYSNSEEELKETISNIPIVAVGDSVMLGAIPNLKTTFSKGYFDAKISRTAWVVNNILVDLKNRNMLGDPIVLHLGTNGDCADCRKQIMETCKGKEVFWLTITNDKSIHLNDSLKKFAQDYENAHIIDWNEISKGHNEYFIADKIHLTEQGRQAYSKAIYDSIYEFYLNKINEEKENLIKQHEDEETKKITFIGNDLLINSYKYLQENFNTSIFIFDKYFEYETLYNKIKEMKENNTLTKKIVLTLDSNLKLTEEQYNNIIKLCEDNNVYIILMEDKYKFDNSINFYEQLVDSYLMPDKIHLTKDGNIALSNLITEKLTMSINNELTDN